MTAIHKALEEGMDDDCDIYYEAGILLEELEAGGTISEADDESPMGDEYNGLFDLDWSTVRVCFALACFSHPNISLLSLMMAESDINEFLFGKPDHDIDELYNFDDI